MIDFTDRMTLTIVKAAFRRSLNSLDNEIAAVRADQSLNPMQRYNKSDVLFESRLRMALIYDRIDENIKAADV